MYQLLPYFGYVSCYPVNQSKNRPLDGGVGSWDNTLCQTPAQSMNRKRVRVIALLAYVSGSYEIGAC